MNETTRILVVEDLPTDAELGEREVRLVLPKSEFLRVESREDFLASLDSFRPDIILSDFKLPNFDGLTALRLAQEFAPEIPFIMITGSMNEDTAVDCMKAGAWDYVIKEHIKRLGTAVLNALEQKRLRLEKKRAAEKSRRWERVFEEAQFGLAHADTGTDTFIEVNATFARERGYTPEELKGRPVLDVYAPEERDAVKRRFGDIDGLGHIVFESVHLRKDGSRFPVLVEVTAIRDDRAQLASRVAYSINITERKRAEEHIRKGLNLEAALRRIDEKILGGANFQEALDIACEAVVEMGYRMCWIGQAMPDYTVRPAAYRGFNPGYLEKIDFRWDDSPEGKGPSGISIRTGQSCVIQNIGESSFYAPWREIALGHGYLSSASFPLISGEEEVVGVLHVYGDRVGAFGDEEVIRLGMFAQQCSIALMNARRIETLCDANQRLAFYVDRMPLAYIVWDLGFGIVEWNPAAEQIFGWKANEAIGKNAYELLIRKEERPQFEHGWSKLLKGDESSYSLNANVRKDGKIITCEWFNALLRDASGNVSRVLSMAHDVTEKAELERQLQTAQKMEAVGTLAGGIAHDFNNSLTGIVGFGELLRMRMAGDRQALHDLDEILRCAERATTLTRQLLTFARRQVIEPVNLNLSTLVADLMKLIGKLVGEHIEVKTSLEKNIPTIHADRGQIEQVVMNLCLNARDAMPEGGRLVVETGDVVLEEKYVRQNPYMRTGRYALLTVSDTGIGMDEKTCKRVFEPFFTTKRPDKGTGLGLAMVYGIVKQHGGFIHLYSEPGKGTAFKVYFPAIEAQPDVFPAVRREEIVRGGTETILLAEDEEAIRALAERILTDLGYTVLVARNGEEAIEMFRQHKEIALAVLDVVMPRKGGKEAYEEMHKQNPRLKVIFMSGYSANAIHDSFVLTAGTPFLQKPFGPTILARKVRDVLDAQ